MSGGGATDDLLNRLQGNVWPGFRKDHQAFVLVSFLNREAGQRWVGAIQRDVATAAEVLAFKHLFERVRVRVGGDEQRALRAVSATWTNVAFTWHGLRTLLGGPAVERFSTAFKRNRVPWTRPEPGDDAVDALLLVAADREADLEAELTRQRTLLDQRDIEELRLYRGDSLPGERRGTEHFGFRDAAAQPRLAGFPDDTGDEPAVPPGEFFLGQPNADGVAPMSTPGWTRDGSFLAFLRLEQRVRDFNAEVERLGARLGVEASAVAASLVGQSQNGDRRPELRLGVSHVSRARPRWLPNGEVNRHRLLRRGIPYGPLAGDAPDGVERGLLFLAYQADIARQFEHVWGQWLNGRDFPLPGAGRDGLVGQTGDPDDAYGGGRAAAARSVVLSGPAGRGGIVDARLSQFVVPGYAGYFFAPGIGALGYLAGGPVEAVPAWTRQ